MGVEATQDNLPCKVRLNRHYFANSVNTHYFGKRDLQCLDNNLQDTGKKMRRVNELTTENNQDLVLC